MTDGYEIDSAAFVELVGDDVITCLIEAAPRKVFTRVLKSLDHLNKAKRLVGVDEEMGALRLIAAEEELVVGIFEWLKLHAGDYPDHGGFAKRHKNHQVKLAFYPVLFQFRFVLAGLMRKGFTLDGLEMALHLKAQPVIIEGQVKLKILSASGDELINFNPLDIAISRDGDDEDAVRFTLFDDLVETVNKQTGLTFKEFLAQRADFRNRLLYAEDAGFITEFDPPFPEFLSLHEQALHDLLWTLATLVTNEPPRGWGLVDQFVWLYRRALHEAKIMTFPEQRSDNSIDGAPLALG